jgi:hypothetical protein
MYGTNQSLKCSPFSSPINIINENNCTSNEYQLNKELFNACRNGDIIKVKKLINSTNVNIRDTNGRKSTVSLTYIQFIFYHHLNKS